MSQPTISFRPTDEAAAALERLLAHYRKQFPTLKQSDVINRLIVEAAQAIKVQAK